MASLGDCGEDVKVDDRGSRGRSGSRSPRRRANGNLGDGDSRSRSRSRSPARRARARRAAKLRERREYNKSQASNLGEFWRCVDYVVHANGGCIRDGLFQYSKIAQQQIGEDSDSDSEGEGEGRMITIRAPSAFKNTELRKVIERLWSAPSVVKVVSVLGKCRPAAILVLLGAVDRMHMTHPLAKKDGGLPELLLEHLRTSAGGLPRKIGEAMDEANCVPGTFAGLRDGRTGSFADACSPGSESAIFLATEGAARALGEGLDVPAVAVVVREWPWKQIRDSRICYMIVRSFVLQGFSLCESRRGLFLEALVEFLGFPESIERRHVPVLTEEKLHLLRTAMSSPAIDVATLVSHIPALFLKGLLLADATGIIPVNKPWALEAMRRVVDGPDYYFEEYKATLLGGTAGVIGRTLFYLARMPGDADALKVAVQFFVKIGSSYTCPPAFLANLVTSGGKGAVLLNEMAKHRDFFFSTQILEKPDVWRALGETTRSCARCTDCTSPCEVVKVLLGLLYTTPVPFACFPLMHKHPRCLEAMCAHNEAMRAYTLETPANLSKFLATTGNIGAFLHYLNASRSKFSPEKARELVALTRVLHGEAAASRTAEILAARGKSA